MEGKHIKLITKLLFKVTNCQSLPTRFLLARHKAALEVYLEATKLNSEDWVGGYLLNEFIVTPLINV